MVHWHHCILGETGRRYSGRLACRAAEVQLVTEGQQVTCAHQEKKDWDETRLWPRVLRGTGTVAKPRSAENAIAGRIAARLGSGTSCLNALLHADAQAKKEQAQENEPGGGCVLGLL